MHLYKYVGPQLHIILSRLLVRFTPPLDLNDPFEVVPHVANLIAPEQADSYFQSLEKDADNRVREVLVEELARLGLPESFAKLVPYDVLRAVKVESLAYMKHVLPAILERAKPTVGAKVQKAVGERFGILCLSEVADNPLMWSHYADAHRGFVIEFDAAHEFFTGGGMSGAVGRVLPVTYASERPGVTMFDPTLCAEDLGRRYVTDVLLTKSVDWAYEREWRMLLPLNDQKVPHVVEGGMHLFRVPATAITRVIVGARCMQETRAAILAAIGVDRRLRHIRLAQARLSTSRYSIDIEDLSMNVRPADAHDASTETR